MTRYILSAIIILTATAFANSKPTVLFDFRNGNANNWIGNMHIAKTEATEEGFRAICSGGEDPWIEGPKIPSLPEGNYDKIQIDITLKTTSGSIELFYGPGFTAGNAISFGIKKRNEWTTESVIIPRRNLAQGSGLIPKATRRNNCRTHSGAANHPIVRSADFEGNTRRLGHGSANAHQAAFLHSSTMKQHGMPSGSTLTNQPCLGHDQPKIIFLVNDKPQTVELNKIKATTKPQNQLSPRSDSDEGNANWIATRTFSKLGDGDIRDNYVQMRPGSRPAPCPHNLFPASFLLPKKTQAMSQGGIPG